MMSSGHCPSRQNAPILITIARIVAASMKTIGTSV